MQILLAQQILLAPEQILQIFRPPNLHIHTNYAEHHNFFVVTLKKDPILFTPWTPHPMKHLTHFLWGIFFSELAFTEVFDLT